MTIMNLAQKIESYLFYTGEPLSIKKLASVFNVTQEDIVHAIEELVQLLEHHGLMIISNDDTVQLVTRPEASQIIQELKKEELSEPLSKSALETLAIILYKNGATKPEIDFIRGVNSGFMLRNLLIRGLIEKIENSEDRRVTKYRATNQSLQFLGIDSIASLPDYEQFAQEFEKRESLSDTSKENIFTQ